MKRLNIVTLGTHDMGRARSFYQNLFEWSPYNKEEEIAFYDMGGWIFALYPYDKLAEDVTISPKGEGFSGVTLAHNVREKNEVAEILSKAEELGAKVLKPAQDVFWGGHSGYFQDPDGHLWEVAYNPFTPTKEDGTLDIKSE